MADHDKPMICDFGLAAIVAEENSRVGERSASILGAGSFRYMGPELLISDFPGTLVTEKSDMWAFGMVVVEVWECRSNV